MSFLLQISLNKEVLNFIRFCKLQDQKTKDDELS